jgi:hypothetical protein
VAAQHYVIPRQIYLMTISGYKNNFITIIFGKIRLYSIRIYSIILGKASGWNNRSFRGITHLRDAHIL